MTETLTPSDTQALYSYFRTSRRSTPSLIRLALANASHAMIGRYVLSLLARERLRWATELELSSARLLRTQHAAELAQADADRDIAATPLDDLFARYASRPPSTGDMPAVLESWASFCARPDGSFVPSGVEARVLALLRCDQLTAWDLKYAMQEPYQVVAKALLALERAGRTRRVPVAGQPERWALVPAAPAGV